MGSYICKVRSKHCGHGNQSEALGRRQREFGMSGFVDLIFSRHFLNLLFGFFSLITFLHLSVTSLDFIFLSCREGGSGGGKFPIQISKNGPMMGMMLINVSVTLKNK